MDETLAITPANSTPPADGPVEHPPRIGRYVIERVLGEGGFGRVYLARDDQLSRPVAIKVPHRQRLAGPADEEAFLTEARIVASLDHPHIVPVYDVGRTDDGLCFVVSKFIEGSDLAARQRLQPPGAVQSADWIAAVAHGLHHAHEQSLIHRDIKPGNILVDVVGKPYLTDFGLALKEEDVGKSAGLTGTPAYMSPEQARGESHRIDARSDLFSLGIVFYELLTGKHLYQGATIQAILEQITTGDVPPIRTVKGDVPPELERICLKCLAKRKGDRYGSARDLAEDLRNWQQARGKLVFISHAPEDEQRAAQLCRLLEERQVGCWLAARDLQPGEYHAEAIVRAIETSAVTVLLLSKHANAAEQVMRQVEQAASKRKRIIPVRFEGADPGKGLEYYLAAAHWIDAGSALEPVANAVAAAVRELRDAIPAVASAGPLPPSTDRRAATIIPRGLRSFDATDADFFLDLLSGPRDRDGLPDAIRFWKSRVEERDADRTFAVGLLYGPSGCGKSSLMKAGLLPRLRPDVHVVFVEATPGDTEARLLKGLRNQCLQLPAGLGLMDSITALRRQRVLPTGHKVLLVLDQFEQWLHAHRAEGEPELVQALRQCDGERVQAVILVRDDFWLAVSRFLHALEVPLVEGHNAALVDLFDLRHAAAVLKAYGRAYGALAEGKLEPEQQAFIDQAVAGLAQEGKVISVRLVIFAEMVKSKPWVPATLKEVGGTAGVGVTFLEETFSARTANPRHRVHAQAARAVLQALLPEQGTDIKGHMKSQGKLLAASGYAAGSREFAELLAILDQEVRLISPTDPEGGNPTAAPLPTGQQWYQLTHDYLVGSLREWLTRKQRQTRRGRAELRLADRAAVWNARPEARNLPAAWEWLNIGWYIRAAERTPAHQSMMRAATRFHGARLLVLAVFLVVLAATGLTIRAQVRDHNRSVQAAGLVQRLLDANTTEVPNIIAELAPFRAWADPLLRAALADAEQAAASAITAAERAKQATRQLHASLALLSVDEAQAEYLAGRLLDAEATEIAVLRAVLAEKKDSLRESLWQVVRQPERGRESQRLRAACALAAYDPDDARWIEAAGPVVEQLVAVNPIVLAHWIEGFRGAKGRLQAALAAAFRDRREERSAERALAASILADYVADQPDGITDLLLDADERQFGVLYPRLRDHGERAAAVLRAELAKARPPDEAGKEQLARRQANAAAVLLRLGESAAVWPLLQHSPDPRTRSYLIHRLGPLGVGAGVVAKRLQDEADVTIRRALILSLGPEEFSREAWTPAGKQQLVAQLQDIYRTAADPGEHAAAEWWLRQWDQSEWLQQIDAALAKDGTQRLAMIQKAFSQDRATSQWWVNSQSQTMVAIPGPVDVMLGSPASEHGRSKDEDSHTKRINRSFAIASRPVTVAEFRRFDPQHTFAEQFAPDLRCPVVRISWHQAAGYCNWLSMQEGLAACYEISAEGVVTQLKQDYLAMSGYRLPTEAEWEYACRAGARTSRFYGESAELLGKYAWFLRNSQDHSWPVGSKKPNDLGFFDMHGNVWNWCQERYREYPREPGAEPLVDGEDQLEINNADDRVMRGGSYYAMPPSVRAAYRANPGRPTIRLLNAGFRPARTIR